MWVRREDLRNRRASRHVMHPVHADGAVAPPFPPLGGVCRWPAAQSLLTGVTGGGRSFAMRPARGRRWHPGVPLATRGAGADGWRATGTAALWAKAVEKGGGWGPSCGAAVAHPTGVCTVDVVLVSRAARPRAVWFPLLCPLRFVPYCVLSLPLRARKEAVEKNVMYVRGPRRYFYIFVPSLHASALQAFALRAPTKSMAGAYGR